MNGPHRPRRKVRTFTWIILAVNFLFLALTIEHGFRSPAAYCAAQRDPNCDPSFDIGGIFGVVLIFGWIAIDAILITSWVVTNRRKATA